MWSNQGGGYDGGGYDHGGGYLSSQGDTRNAGTSQDKKKTRAQHIMPCTIARLMKAEHVEDRFVSEGVELNQVSILGLIRSVQESSTNQTYEVDDMTGPVIDVRVFADNDANTPESERVPLLRENTYMWACGHLRSFGNKRNVTAFKTRMITDMNELTNHILECIYAHVYHAKGLHLLNQNAASNKNSVNPGTSGMAVGVTGGDADMGLTTAQVQVLNLIRSCVEDQGITVSHLANKLSGLPKKTISDALEFLSSEGHIYSTIDDEHFKATDSV